MALVDATDTSDANTSDFDHPSCTEIVDVGS